MSLVFWIRRERSFNCTERANSPANNILIKFLKQISRNYLNNIAFTKKLFSKQQPISQKIYNLLNFNKMQFAHKISYLLRISPAKDALSFACHRHNSDDQFTKAPSYSSSPSPSPSPSPSGNASSSSRVHCAISCGVTPSGWFMCASNRSLNSCAES